MKRILIIDEVGFSRVCSAILELEGHKVEVIEDIENLSLKLDNKEFSLIITSYPFGSVLFEALKKLDLPTIILTPHINKEIINLLKGFDNSYCLIKPIDYQKFRTLVNQLVDCDSNKIGEYNIL
ncbi:MAG: DNA-binding response regulator [Nitrospirota bacterium]